MEIILNVFRVAWGVLTDLLWDGVMHWFRRRFQAALTGGLTLMIGRRPSMRSSSVSR